MSTHESLMMGAYLSSKASIAALVIRPSSAAVDDGGDGPNGVWARSTGDAEARPASAASSCGLRMMRLLGYERVCGECEMKVNMADGRCGVK